MADLHIYYVKIVSRKNHRDGAVDLGVQIISSFDYGEACWKQAEPITPPQQTAPTTRAKTTAIIARLARSVTGSVLQASEGGWKESNGSPCIADAEEQHILEQLVTTSAFCIISCQEPLSYCPFTPIEWICLVSISPTIPMLQKLLENADKLSSYTVSALLTPNPLNFRRNIRSAPPCITPRPPSPETMFPLQITRKQHLALMLGGAHRIRLKPPRTNMLEALEQELSKTQTRELRSLEIARSIPSEAPVNFDNVNPSAPSTRGSQTRQQYIYEKKLPQIYSLLSLITPLLKEKPVRILDVGGGRGDLARNILWYAETYLNRWHDEITVVDKNPNCPPPQHDRISLVICDFTTYQPEDDTYDITIALHACGNLSDSILERALRWSRQSVIVVPCCYGKITPSHFLNVLSERNQQPDVSEKAMLLINEGRLKNFCQLEGWKWEMYRFSRSYSAKNMVLFGLKTNVG